jgi:hypothetical protein
MTDLDILKAARAGIADPAHWCRRYFATTDAGRPTTPHEEDAAKCCALGSLERVCGWLAVSLGRHVPDPPPETAQYRRCRDRLEVAALRRFQTNLTGTNDFRGHAQVLEVYDTAIAELEAKSGVG